MCMDNEILFFPMSKKPERDESDPSFSKTVIIYGSQSFVELGYFDFDADQWTHFGENLFLLKCWCYIPNPTVLIDNTEWEAIALKGYKKAYIKCHY